MSDSLSIFDMVPGNRVADRFRVVRPHRQGAMSSAFEVEDEQTNERCELQLFPPALFEDEEQAAEFSASWQPWIRIDQPSVLGVRELVMLGPTSMLLVTDFPAGPCLRDVLKERKRFASEDVVRIGRQLLDGLVAIHSEGAVHGDIKPGTVHIEGSGADTIAVMVDGGITPGLWSAKDLGDKTALIGTPYYAPAEQFSGDCPDVQSDIYNVATVLFELATGVLPWSGTNILEVFQAKLERAAPTMRKRAPELEIAPELEQAIAGGLMAERRRRYETAEQFLDKLAACAPA